MQKILVEKLRVQGSLIEIGTVVGTPSDYTTQEVYQFPSREPPRVPRAGELKRATWMETTLQTGGTNDCFVHLIFIAFPH